MLALLKDKEQSKWDLALSARDRAREELYTFIDELTEE
jgi:hypothetical protein